MKLRGLIVKTVGIVEPVRQALVPLEEGVRAAFIFGSVARGDDTASSDIDVLVISDSLGYSELFDALQLAEAALARPVRPTVLSTQEWRKQRDSKNSFAARIAAQPRLSVVGSEDDIT